MAEETAGLSVTAFSRQEESLPGTSAAAAACVPAAGRLFHSNSLHWLGSAAAAAAASCRHAAVACTACSSPRPMGKGKGGGKTKSRARIVGGLWHGVLLCWEWGQRFGTLEAACSVCLMLKQLCLIGVMRSGQFSAHPWKLGAGKSHCRPQGRVWLCVCCSAQGWQALRSVMAMIHQ